GGAGAVPRGAPARGAPAPPRPAPGARAARDQAQSASRLAVGLVAVYKALGGEAVASASMRVEGLRPEDL
ncbi:hypothetical protein ACCC97_28665, partial [Variovorax sp. Varisp85]|uniref:hypothetical protein n=1 Tax=Variovorax sp. Varisp85 TaxID=3243059 RepID=UPI0039A663FF